MPPPLPGARVEPSQEAGAEEAVSGVGVTAAPSMQDDAVVSGMTGSPRALLSWLRAEEQRLLQRLLSNGDRLADEASEI